MFVLLLLLVIAFSSGFFIIRASFLVALLLLLLLLCSWNTFFVWMPSMGKRRRNRDNWLLLQRCYCCYCCCFFFLEFCRVFCVLVLVTDDELASVCLFSLRCLVRKKKKKMQQMSFPQALTDRHNENNTLHKSNQSDSPSLPSHAHWSICRFPSFLPSSSFVFPSRLLNSFTVVRHRERERELQILSPSFCYSSCSCSCSYCGSPSSSDFPLVLRKEPFLWSCYIYLLAGNFSRGMHFRVCLCERISENCQAERENWIEISECRERERNLRFVCFLCCFSDQDCGAWICSKLCSRLHSFLSSCWRNDYEKSCTITTKCRNAMEDRLKQKRSRAAAASFSFFP